MSRSTIVVGAGSAGGALAARLSEDAAHEVILIEAGPDYPDPGAVPDDIRDASEMSVERHDWGLQAYYTEPPEERGLQPYPRGKVVGGSSAVNAAVAQRATVEDLDEWVADGNDEWSYDATLEFFRRVENDLDFGEAPWHGTDGPVPIRRHTREDFSAIAKAFEQACLDRGFPACDDFNAKGSTGVGGATRNLIGGDGDVRASALLTYVAEARDRPNLTIVPGTTCRRVLFEGRRAIGVEIERDGQVEELHADRIVLSTGALLTPHILMLSGIGPAETLERVGIEPVHVNEAVGQNMRDHVFTPILALLKEQTDKVGVRVQMKYTTDVGGLTDDITLWCAVFDPATINLDVDTQGKRAMTLVSLLAKPVSTGWVTITSADPGVPPEVHCNYLAEQSDVERVKAAMRLSWELTTSSPMQEEIETILFPDAETVADDAKLEAYVRQTSTCSFHATSTCRMGPVGDANAVVDQRLAVQGIEGLWIGDASVMPNVPTALTNLTAYMIGERLADILKHHPYPAAEASVAGAVADG